MPLACTPSRPDALRCAPQSASRRRLLLGSVGLAVVRPRPARADDGAIDTAAAPPASTPASTADQTPIVQELLARSARNKAVHDADRLASYYRRNRDALAVMVDGGAGEMLRPETKAAIERWLAANPPYLQNADIFSARIGSARKGLKSRAEFVFACAPHAAVRPEPGGDASDGELGAGPDPRTWWTWRDDGPGMRPSLAAAYGGWGESRDVLLAALRTHAPVDGLLGFSQGATAAALLLVELVTHPVSGLTPPGFAVLAGGFLPRDPAFAARVVDARVPVLFIAGDADATVPPARSEALATALAPTSAAWVRHPGGHCVPTMSGGTKAAVAAFLDGPARASVGL